jgi:hypothetical protein
MWKELAMEIQCDELSTRDIYGSDPLAKVLLGRWRVRPLTLAFAVFLGGAIYLTLLSAAFGYLLPRADVFRTSLQDKYNQVNFFFIFPAVAYYYVWQSGNIVKVYGTVMKCVRPTGDEIAFPISQIQALHAKLRWWVPGLLFGILGIGLGTHDNIGKLGDYWYAANWLMISILQFARGIIFYMLIVVTARHLATTAGLNRIFAQAEFPVIVTSADLSTGFQAISNYALSFAAIAATVGLSLGLAPLLGKPGFEYAINVTLYFILAPIGFFLPFWQAHQKMVQAKGHILGRLSEELQSEFEHLLESLLEDNDQKHGRLEVMWERLRAIQEAIELTKESPNWPFQENTIYKLGATILSPFAFAILRLLFTVLFDLVEGLILP